MDTSQQYIEMSRKAKRFFPKGMLMSLDYNTFWAQRHNDGWVIDARGCIPKDDIPLFRQDQLHKMIERNYILYSDPQAEGYPYTVEYFDYDGKEDKRFSSNSIEQSMLMATMWHNFNKTWNGEDWI